MGIKSLEVKNFKSFKDLTVNFDDFNIVIGANASGKSNFINIFKFLKDIVTSGLDNAISLQGGADYIKNINAKANENLSIEITFTNVVKKHLISKSLRMDVEEATYGFELSFGTNSEFKIIRDELALKCKFFNLEIKNEKNKNGKKIFKEEITVCRDNNGKIQVKLPENPQLKELEEKDILSPLYIGISKNKASLINNILIISMLSSVPLLSAISTKLGIYNFDPKLSKETSKTIGMAELEENGSNLSIVLRNIIKNKDNKRKLLNLISEFLTFINDLDIKENIDKSLYFKIKESYSKKDLPAIFISNGTINIIALIVALYFEEKELIILEEPERNIHPHLIAKVVDAIKDASKNRQILITTHNPELIKHVDLEKILLVSRDDDGFSRIYSPANKESVKSFLKNDIGIDDLYVDNFLEGLMHVSE